MIGSFQKALLILGCGLCLTQCIDDKKQLNGFSFEITPNRPLALAAPRSYIDYTGTVVQVPPVNIQVSFRVSNSSGKTVTVQSFKCDTSYNDRGRPGTYSITFDPGSLQTGGIPNTVLSVIPTGTVDALIDSNESVTITTTSVAAVYFGSLPNTQSLIFTFRCNLLGWVGDKFNPEERLHYQFFFTTQ